MQDTTLVIIPTYNEVDNIKPLVTKVLNLGLNLHVLIVDDNSPDGTGKMAERLASEDSAVKVLHRSGKLGLGTAYSSGFRCALEQGYNHIVTMDADFSHPPDRIPALVAEARRYDVVIGSRYVPGGRVIGSPRLRRFISRGANFLATRLLRLQARDCTAGFRCYRRAVLESIDFESILSTGYSFLIEMTYRCQRAGFTVGEVPITFRDRVRGQSKITRTEIVRAFYTLIRLRMDLLPWARLSSLRANLSRGHR